MIQQRLSCRWLFKQNVVWPFALALLKAGRSMPARIAMIAITTSSSIKVKASRGCALTFVFTDVMTPTLRFVETIVRATCRGAHCNGVLITGDNWRRRNRRPARIGKRSGALEQETRG